MPTISNLADYGMIANSVKDELLTPEQTAMQGQQIKSLALGNQAQEMKNSAGKKQMEADALIQQSIQKNAQVDPATGQVKINHAQVAADLANAGHADKAYAYMDQQQKVVYEKHKDSIEQIARAANGVLSVAPEYRPTAYMQTLAQLKQNGVDTTGAPEQYTPQTEEYLKKIKNQAVDAKTHFEAENKDGENVFLSTPNGYIAANKRTVNTQVLTDANGNPYIPSNIDIGAQSNLIRGKERAKAEVELATKPEIAAAVANAENTAKNVQGAKKSESVANQLLSNIAEARKILPYATGSLAGAAADKITGAAGVATESSKAAAQLDTLAGWMVSNVPRMEGPQSNIDVENYKTMAARVGNRQDPIETRLAALDVLERLQKKYSEQNKAVINQGGSGKGSATPGINPVTKPTKESNDALARELGL